MFGVVYQFTVTPGHEDAFVASWAKLTHSIADKRGGLGSRLHDAGDGVWFAYAQWASRETWEAAGKLESADPEASAAMRECLANVETIIAGDVSHDLLKKA